MNDTPNATPPRLPARIAESALLDVAKDLPGKRILSTSMGRGQAARTLYRERSDASVSLWYLDQFQQHLAIADHHADEPSWTPTTTPKADHQLAILCDTDLPNEEFDLALIPCSIRGEAELQRDLLQQAYSNLVMGGRLVTSVDNLNDTWLHDQLKAFGTKVTVIRSDAAVVYVLRKEGELKRQRQFDCEFSFRSRGVSITATTRPGVFSHRRLDGGAKALMEAVTIEAGERVIDIGCGCGSVSLSLAKQAKGIHTLAIDSNARAIQCTRRGALKNELNDFHARLTCDGQCDAPGSYDVAVCNPPYYANFRIARLFVEAAKQALRPGGRLFVVTKQASWYEENLVTQWHDITVTPGKQYAIVECWK